MGKSSEIFATAVALAAALATTAAAIDCGDLPRGKNPPPDEISRAVEELSFSYGVPTEIVKGVAYQESGVQQWRADGSFVYNTTDCGLGMMQLTGSTAEQFDVERLKTDWRYNLEAGVKVLQAKWKRVLNERWRGPPGAGTTKKLPLPDPAVLENWYYALSYYQGKRTGEYPTKVFNHLKNRPGVVARLLPKPIALSSPEAAIPGFAYGGGYTALPGDRFVLEDGREVRAATHVGTIGDPALLERLDQVLAAAEKAREKDEIRKAVRFYQAVVKIKPDSPAARKAEAALADLSARAREALEEAARLEEAKDWAGALLAYERVEDRWLGLPEADEAQARAARIRSDPELKAAAERIEREKEARVLLAKAERALERRDILETLRCLRKCAGGYGDTAAAAEAGDRLRCIESDEGLMAEARERERARKLREWLATGDAYLANDLPERAIATWRKVIEAAPGSEEAEAARRRIADAEAGRER